MNTDCALCIHLSRSFPPLFSVTTSLFSHDFNSHNSPLFTSKIFLFWPFKFILFLSVLLDHNFLIVTKLTFPCPPKFHTPKNFIFPFSSLLLLYSLFKHCLYTVAGDSIAFLRLPLYILIFQSAISTHQSYCLTYQAIFFVVNIIT